LQVSGLLKDRKLSGEKKLSMQKNRTNTEWQRDLRSDGPSQEEAIIDLRDLLLRATLYTLNRSPGIMVNWDQDEITQWAEDCTQDALIAVLGHLAEFRGDSKFSTWAYKFAINTTYMALRRKHWKDVPLDKLTDGYFKDQSQVHDQDLSVLQGEVWETIRDTIRDELTEKQRQVLELIVFDEVPMDVVVQHFGANRNAIYKLLHDARQKLKLKLLEKGFGTQEAVDLFGTKR
jgi:RNA polymerase sigma-70 factor, ECF subfamily